MPQGVWVQIPPGAPGWPLRLSARTSGSHPEKRSSTLLGAANFGKIIKYTLFCLIGLLILAIAALLIFEQPVPDSLLRRITQSLSNADYLVRANSASFRFSRGLKINNLRILDRRKPASHPVISASCVDLALNLRRIPWSKSTLIRSVTVTDLRYPRLPDSYYIPDSVEFPGRPDFQEQDEPLELDLPTLQPFKLTLIRPEILGVTPRKVAAESVSVSTEGIRVDGIRLDWPDADAQMSLDGVFELNLETQRVEGEVHGLARQHHIRPMLVALDITFHLRTPAGPSTSACSCATLTRTPESPSVRSSQTLQTAAACLEPSFTRTPTTSDTWTSSTCNPTRRSPTHSPSPT